MSCEFCDKKGLPIVPVRYAISGPDSHAPKLAAPFKPEVNVPLGSSHYTLRLIREGYVYVFDAARQGAPGKGWTEYYVTPDGYFFKLPPRGPMSVKPKLPTQFACSAEHATLAACITLPDAKRDRDIWLSFTEHPWTDALLARHFDQSFRAKHMRKIVLAGGKVADSGDHHVPITQVDKVVAEYTMEPKAAVQAFRQWGAPWAFQPRQPHAQALRERAQELAPNAGVVLALDDPAGLLQEIALLMKWHELSLTAEPQTERLLGASIAIENIRQGVQKQAILAEKAAAEDLANQQLSQPDIGELLPWMDDYRKQKHARIAQMRDVSPAEATRAQEQAWRKYTAKFDDAARSRWQAQFAQRVQALDAEHLAPLAKAHAAWMQSQALARCFECNVDDTDVRHGYLFVEVLTNCIASTSDKIACQKPYKDWLQGADPTDSANLLLRALTYFNKDLAEELKSAANSVSYSTLAWDKVSEAYARATDKLLAGEPDHLGGFVGAALMGPLSSVLRKAAGGVVFPSLVALGAIARQPFIEVAITGSRKDFSKALTQALIAHSGQYTRPIELERAWQQEIKWKQLQGVKLEGQTQTKWLLMVDVDHIADIPSSVKTTAQRAQWLAQRVKTIEHVQKLKLLDMIKWRRLVQGAASTITKTTLPLAGALAGLLANGFAYQTVVEDEAKSMHNVRDENRNRVLAQGAQLVGAMAGVAETAVTRIPMLMMRWAPRFGQLALKVAAGAAKVLGIGGSLAMGLLDIWRGEQERGQGNYQSMTAYFVSGGLTIAATVCLALGWTGIGLLLAACMIAWAFIMTELVDNKVQEWLKRCYWGNLVVERYQSREQEEKQLEAAFKG